jgi:drug/metabolite transporter (DMT)-like permease
LRKSKKIYTGILLVSTMLGAFGQILFKIGVMSGILQLFIYIIIGIACYLLSTVLYFYVLSRTHLSWAYSFTGLSYIFASLIAFLFLGEQVPMLRWLGILVIAIGTALIGVS